VPEKLSIFWLDDQPTFVKYVAERLELRGHSVRQFRTEEEAMEALESLGVPSVLVQDLSRPVAGSRGEGLVDPEAGWKLYSTLKVRFPQLPVVICTFDAHFREAKRKASDFNLQLVAKRPFDPASFHDLLLRVVGSQQPTFALEGSFPQIVQVDFSKINSALLKHLAKKPEDLDHISPGNFERLVERVLLELGYEVQRTPLTRDGGVDLWAIQRNDLADTIVAIDAKKYRRGKIIGPEPVRAIHGVVNFSGASVGMIVTTARFGPAATELAKQHRFRLALKDFEGVHEWIQKVARG